VLVRRLMCAALTASALLLVPASAGAAPTAIGIGEQSPAIFQDPAWKAINSPYVRYVVAWDALRVPEQKAETDAYLASARDAGAQVLLGFSRSRSPRKQRRKYLPSPSRLRREFIAFRRHYPWVKTYFTWNEANHRGQPTWNRPDIVARYYDMLRRNCRSCTIVGPSVLDTLAMPSWVREVERRTKHRVKIWALHNYIDANRFRTRGTRSLLAATRKTKSKIWFTETGGIVRRDNGSRIEFAESKTHAVKATRQVERLARLSRRVKRIYFYHWVAPAPDATWDSALIDRRGRPRPAYRVVRTYIRHARAANRLIRSRKAKRQR
jgi:polysaccharide biosynthesis protein PslG